MEKQNKLHRYVLCEELFEQSYFDKSVDLRRRLMNSKDEFTFSFAFFYNL